MDLSWLFLMCLCVAGGVMYNVGFKMAPGGMSPLLVSGIVGFTVFAVQSVLLLLAKYVFKYDVAGGATAHGAALAVMAGLGAALIDVSFFLALRRGSPSATVAFWTVGSIVAFSIFSVLVFKEAMTMGKACGILLGGASLYLLTRESGAGN